MFGISEETKVEALTKMKEVLVANGVENLPSDEVLREAMDSAIKVIARSFGM